MKKRELRKALRRKAMRIDWMGVAAQISENVSNVHQVRCPNCGEAKLDYIYIGDEETRIGFLQVWCNKCLKGIYLSRVIAPPNAKFVTFDSDAKSIVPPIEFVGYR